MEINFDHTQIREACRQFSDKVVADEKKFNAKQAKLFKLERNLCIASIACFAVAGVAELITRSAK